MNPEIVCLLHEADDDHGSVYADGRFIVNIHRDHIPMNANERRRREKREKLAWRVFHHWSLAELGGQKDADEIEKLASPKMEVQS